MLHEPTPPVVVPCVDVLPAVFLHPEFGCLNGGVLFGVLVAHGFMGSTLTLILKEWVCSPLVLKLLVFLSYVAWRISSIFSTA